MVGLCCQSVGAFGSAILRMHNNFRVTYCNQLWFLIGIWRGTQANLRKQSRAILVRPQNAIVLMEGIRLYFNALQ